MTGTWASGFADGDVITAAEFRKSAGSIFDTTLGVSAVSVDITSILATYAHLMVTVYARSDNAAAGASILMRLNGDTGSNYDYQQLLGSASTAGASEAFAQGAIVVGACPAASAAANLFSSTEVFIPNYAGSSNNKQVISMNGQKTGATTGLMSVNVFSGSWRSNAAINRITFFPNANFVAGTRVTIHALGA